jgi:hypothetical protein
MGPGLRRDGVICSDGTMKANWIISSNAGIHGPARMVLSEMMRSQKTTKSITDGTMCSGFHRNDNIIAGAGINRTIPGNSGSKLNR